MSAPGANAGAVGFAIGGLVFVGLGAFALRFRRWLWTHPPLPYRSQRRAKVPDEYEDWRVMYILSFVVGPCIFIALGTVLLLVALLSAV